MVEVQGKVSSSDSAPVKLEDVLPQRYSVPCEFKGLIFVRYFDHVIFNRASALAIQPQVWQAVGWLVYECNLYVTIVWDHDAEPPTLRGGDSKASGVVLLKSDILELQKLPVNELPLQKNSECHLNLEQTTVKTEYAPSDKGGEKLSPKINKRKGQK